MKSVLVAFGLLLGGFAHAHSGHDHNNSSMTHLVFANGLVHAHATWETGPQLAAESVLRIEWKNGADHSPTEPPGEFKVVLWMPAMGHGSAPTQIQRVVDVEGQSLTGVYRISNIAFLMGGDWLVNVVLNLPDGSQETRSISVSLPTDGDGHHH